MGNAFIANPFAYKVNERRIKRVRKYLGKDFQIFYTTIGSNGFYIPGYNPSDFERVYVIGGDGTLNGFVNLSLRFQHIPEIAWIPSGTGNGYCVALHQPIDFDETLELALYGQARPVDLIHVTEPFDRYVLNLFDVGFMAYSLKLKNLMGKGMLVHTVCAFSALKNFERFTLENCVLDGKVIVEKEEISCIAVGKGITPSRFPLLEVLPGGNLDDGEMRLAIYPKDKARLFAIGMKILGGGLISRAEESGKCLEMTCSPANVQYDGNYAGSRKGARYKMHVEPGKIKLIRP